MKKSILLLFSLMLCLILSPWVYAETVEKDKAFYEVNADGQTVSLESITDNEQKETYRILEKETFRNCYSLRKIDLPKSLRTIKAGMFKSCGFDQLAIPKSVKSIGKNALQVTTKALKEKMEYRELEY